ncbi:hypothetical protein Pelo_18937 [Pelomyxa schiedti]|nr:hypothetical protein Pelo_18937 [Pelomyxa schiedti]
MMDAALSKLLMSFPDPPRTGTCGVSSGGSGPESFVVDSSSGENYTGFVGGDLAVLERACRDEASAADREQLKTLFIERPVLQVERAIEHVQTEIAQQLLSQNTKVRKLFKGTLPSIHLDKRYLDFGVGIGCKCPLTRGLIDEITITNTGHEKVKPQ